MQLIWTTAGRARLVNPDNTGTNAVAFAQIAVGSGQTAATADDTALESEIQRLDTISGQAVDDDIIHVVYRDETSATYAVYEIGLIAGDGTLLARYAQAGDPIIEKAGPSTALLPIDAVLVDGAVAEVTFPSTEFSNPPAGHDTPGVAPLATGDEAAAGVNDSKIMTPQAVRRAVDGTINPDRETGQRYRIVFIDGSMGIAPEEQ